MADAANTAKYKQKQQSAFEKIKAKCVEVEITKAVETGDVYNRVQSKVKVNHYALTLDLEERDIKGNVKSDHKKFMVEAVSGIVDTSMKINHSGKDEVISHVKPLNYDGITDIYYEVYSVR